MRRLLPIALLTFAVVAALARPARAAPIRVAGTVVDDHGEPVAGAVVSAGKVEATTDERGRFVITAADRGELVVFAEGFAPYTARAPDPRVHAGAGGRGARGGARGDQADRVQARRRGDPHDAGRDERRAARGHDPSRRGAHPVLVRRARPARHVAPG